MYDLHVDRVIGIGYLNEEGWWNFDRISLFQIDTACKDCNDQYTVTVVIQSLSSNPGAEFKIWPEIYNNTVVKDNTTNRNTTTHSNSY
jgi:hypothetical protein